LGGSALPFVDMAANQSQFSAKLKEVLTPAFADYGLLLRSFYVESLSLPEELQQHLDKASSMRLVGDLKAYTQYQVAESIPTAASNPGGIAGAGAGLGAGLAIGQTFASQIAGATGPAGSTGPASSTPPAATPAEDPIALLERLHGLVTKGIITDAEFQAKKTEILSKIR
jgi:membrane protease subunit (stomatin/prohibitin family)